MYHNYKIDYKNVILRPIEEGDIEYLRNWRNNPQNTNFLRKIPYITPKMQKEWYEKYLQNDDEICFGILENDELNRLVGSLSLYNFFEGSCFFGKILVGDEEAHGRKIGMNATEAALQIAFERLGMREVKLYVYSDNSVAMSVYKQAGFQIFDEHYVSNGIKEFTMIKRREVL